MYIYVDDNEQTAFYDLTKARKLYLDKYIGRENYTLTIEWSNDTAQEDSYDVLYEFDSKELAKAVLEDIILATRNPDNTTYYLIEEIEHLRNKLDKENK